MWGADSNPVLLLVPPVPGTTPHSHFPPPMSALPDSFLKPKDTPPLGHWLACPTGVRRQEDTDLADELTGLAWAQDCMNFKLWLPFLAVETWASHLDLLLFSVLICRMGIIITQTAQWRWEDSMTWSREAESAPWRTHVKCAWEQKGEQ